MAASNLGRSALSTSACSPKMVSYLICFCAMFSMKSTAVEEPRMVDTQMGECRRPGLLNVFCHSDYHVTSHQSGQITYRYRFQIDSSGITGPKNVKQMILV
jgi:hypothetical protein